MQDVVSILRGLVAIFAQWMAARQKARAEENRRAIARAGADALIGLFNPAGKDAPADPAHTGQHGEDGKSR